MNLNKSFFYFTLSPLLGIIEAFKNLRNKESIIVIFLFCLCFGFCFNVGTERIEGSSDGIAMRIIFEENKDISTTQFIDYLSEYFEFDTGAQDIYIVTMSYLVGKITNNYHFFFLALACVFAFFQLKCLRYFVKDKNFTNSLICIILTCLFLWNNIYNINGARFWTAAWIGIYCVFKIFYDKELSYFLLAICTPMIHASFIIFPIIIIVAYLLKNFRNPLIILFCISWVFSIFLQDFQIYFFNNIDLPIAISKKIDYYTDSEYIQSLSKGTGFYWVSLLFKILSRNYINFMILLIVSNDKNNNNSNAIHVIRFMLILAIFSNFGMIIPTIGGRFFAVNYALVAYSFLVIFGDYKYKKLVYLLPFVWFMNLFYLYKDVTDVLDLGFILTPIFSFFRYIYIV